MWQSALGCTCSGRRTFLRAVLASCAAAPTFTWSKRASASDTVRIGFPTSDHYAPVFVARQKKFFESAGLNVEYKSFATGGPVIEGLTSKSLDIGFMGTPGLISVARGFAMTGVMGMALEGSGILTRQGGVEKIDELRGKRVGMPAKGSIAHLLLLRALTQANIDPESVRIIEIRDADGIRVGLQRGEIDAAAIWEPWVYQLEQAEGIKRLALSHDVWPHHQCDLMWVGNSFLKERPEVVKVVVDGVLQGMRYITHDFPQSTGMVSAALGVGNNVESHSMERQQFTHILQKQNISDQYRLLAKVNIVKESEIPAWSRLVDEPMYEYAKSTWQTLTKA